MAGSRWKCRRCWPTTRPARWLRPRICTREQRGRICSSRSLVPRKACPPLKKRSSPGYRSTSRCCFRGSTTWRRPRHSCVVSSDASTAGLHANVGSVASVFISRWDAAVMRQSTRRLCKTVLASPSPSAPTRHIVTCWTSPAWQRIVQAGYNPQRLLWASTGTKDPKASDVLYIKALAAPFTVNTMPEGTLKALADHGEVGSVLPADGGDCEAGLGAVRQSRHRHRCPGSAASRRRGEVVRKIPGTN